MKKRTLLSILIIVMLTITVAAAKGNTVRSLSFSDPTIDNKAAENTSGISDIRQTDAGVIDGECYVTIEWTGSSSFYAIEQMDGEKWVYLGVTNEQKVNVKGGIQAGQLLSFRISPADESGEKLDPQGTGAVIENVKTVPDKQKKPDLIHWYRASDAADFSWLPDEFVDGYQVKVVNLSGKKLYKTSISNTAFTEPQISDETAAGAASGSAASGSAASGSASVVSLSPSYRGKVAGIKVRGYIIVNDKKKYGAWSDTYYYASAKEIKLSGYKDTITVKGLKVKDAEKKEVYISKKKNSGFKLAGSAGAKETSVKVSEFGKNLIVSDKSYYVRVFYYYKIDDKLEKSPVYDEGKVYVEPTYLYLN